MISCGGGIHFTCLCVFIEWITVGVYSVWSNSNKLVSMGNIVTSYCGMRIEHPVGTVMIPLLLIVNVSSGPGVGFLRGQLTWMVVSVGTEKTVKLG